MFDYTLYYWPVQFRGEFVRSVLCHVDCTWREAGAEATATLKAEDPEAQLVPHMGPPVLTDHGRDLHISQMPAILAYLGEKHGLMGDDPVIRAMNHKLIADANDVLYEMTRYNGEQMWTKDAWEAFRPRLVRWMKMFEATGGRHGMAAGSGYILGTEAPCLGDLVTATLWGRMTTIIAPLGPTLERNAPGIAGLCRSIAALPSQAELRRQSDTLYGDVWCGGQIEASLRAMV